MKKTVCSLILSVLFTSTLFAQQTDWTKRISMLPVTSESDTVTPVLADVINSSAGIGIQFLPGCTYIETDESLNPEVAAANDQLDFVLYGQVYQDNGYVLELSLFDSAAQTYQTETKVISRSLDIFFIIDELIEPILNKASGQELSYGTLEFLNSGDPDVTYMITMNGRSVGKDITAISRLPTGQYSIRIEQDNERIETVFESSILIETNKPTIVEFETIDHIKRKELLKNHILNHPEFSMIGEYEGHYYYAFSALDYTWEESRVACEILGGHLVVISSNSESRFIRSKLDEKPYPCHHFIGYYYNNNSESWEWVNDEESRYRNWASGMPEYEEPGRTAIIWSYYDLSGLYFPGHSNINAFNNRYMYKWLDVSAIRYNGFILETDTPLEIP